VRQGHPRCRQVGNAWVQLLCVHLSSTHGKSMLLSAYMWHACTHAHAHWKDNSIHLPESCMQNSVTQQGLAIGKCTIVILLLVPTYALPPTTLLHSFHPLSAMQAGIMCLMIEVSTGSGRQLCLWRILLAQQVFGESMAEAWVCWGTWLPSAGRRLGIQLQSAVAL
jgi:hypothetical protein